jgi:DinB superfamily
MLGHLIDAERVFTYRALRFARQDETPLPGFDEDAYVAAAHADARSIDNLLEEFAAVRQATIALFRSLSEEDKWRGGMSNGNPISVYALFYSTVGHFNHHLGVLEARY